MIIGRSTNNLQIKTIESSGTPVVNFTVATNRKFKNRDGNVMEDAEYHRCVCYGKGAEVLWKYLTKWKKVYIEWRLRTRKRQDSTGQDRFSTEIIVDNFIFLDNRPTGDEMGSEGSFSEEWLEKPAEDNTAYDNPEDEEVPF